jgi:hypothetical protein
LSLIRRSSIRVLVFMMQKININGLALRIMSRAAAAIDTRSHLEGWANSSLHARSKKTRFASPPGHDPKGSRRVRNSWAGPDPRRATMATQRQIEANLRNLKRSMGSRIEIGESRSRFNALKHGRRSRSTSPPSSPIDGPRAAMSTGRRGRPLGARPRPSPPRSRSSGASEPSTPSPPPRSGGPSSPGTRTAPSTRPPSSADCPRTWCSSRDRKTTRRKPPGFSPSG